MVEQDLDLLHAALLGQRDHPAQPLEQAIVGNHRLGVEIVDAAAGT